MIGRLGGLPRRTAHARAVELLDQFELTDAADRPLEGYSGGMRRRLDLAAGLVTHPHPVAASLIWSVALIAIAAPLATVLFRRRTVD
jgi:ABC-type taurine transport system ATPase subunit